MKKILILLNCFVLLIAGCKNEKTDDTRVDSAVVAPTLSPLSDTAKTAADPAVPKKIDSMPVEKKIAASPVPANKSAATAKPKEDEVRVKKVSKKGRIILELLKVNMQEKMEADKEGVYNHAEVMPLYPGGESALRRYLEDHIQYPDNALNNEVQGTVKVQFTVDEQGKIISPAVISQKLGSGLEEEALRVLRSMPRWIPGQVQGQNVKTRFTLPISYQIN
jgi:protein TonB